MSTLQNPNPEASLGAALPLLSGRVRRVVTGHNAQGKSCVISDEIVDLDTVPGQGARFAALWSTSGEEPIGKFSPGEPHDLRPTTAPHVDPAPGGTRLIVVSLPPHANPKPDLQNRVGFHRSATIDYVFMLGGEIFFLLDEQEVKLKAGDMLIIRNVDHSWRNEGPEAASFVAFLAKVG